MYVHMYMYIYTYTYEILSTYTYTYESLERPKNCPSCTCLQGVVDL